MVRRPPISTRTATLFPYTALLRSILLLAVAFAAAWVAARKPADILFMVSAAFSFAASSFFPALVMGIFWRRANKWGATLGMLAGLMMTFGYMAHTHPWLREWVFGVDRGQPRSEERRVGKGCVSTGRSRWSPSH